jgi:hypothetical protein
MFLQKTVITPLLIALSLADAFVPQIHLSDFRCSQIFFTDDIATEAPHHLPHYIQLLPQPPRFAPPIHLLKEAVPESLTTLGAAQEAQYNGEWEEVNGKFMPLDASMTRSEREVQAYMNQMMGP